MSGDEPAKTPQFVRVSLTGSTRSPDLHAATTLGPDEVQRRLNALTT